MLKPIEPGPAAVWEEQSKERLAIKDLLDEQGGRRTRGQVLADKMALLVGSWPFVISQTVFIFLWIVINSILTAYALLVKSWDPYPFILLNFVLSFQAAYTGPILLISANRAAERDRKLARKDFEYSMRIEEQLEVILRHLVHQDRLLNRYIEEAEQNNKAEDP